MATPRIRHGAPVPLFDRLVDGEPQVGAERQPLRALDRDGLRRSVVREVERLLNTRCPVTEEDLEGRERTVIDYGLADFGAISARSGADAKRLAAAVERTVTAFEPRLRDVKAAMEGIDRIDAALVIRIEARLVSGDIDEPIGFTTAIRELLRGRG